MENYNKYVEKLKRHSESVDYGLMYEKIENKISSNKRIFYAELGSAFASGAVLVFICLLAYFNYANLKIQSLDYLNGYVMNQSELNGDKVINYVFYR